MENKEEEETTTTTTTEITDGMRLRKKDRRGSMRRPAGGTKENTLGENAHLMREETTTKVTTEITTITEETRAIRMQATTIGGPQDCIMWMNTGT